MSFNHDYDCDAVTGRPVGEDACNCTSSTAYRAALAASVNDSEATVTHRRRLPQIYADSTREQLILWLCDNDRNGCYSDSDCIAEGWGVLTIDTAWSLIDLCLEGS